MTTDTKIAVKAGRPSRSLDEEIAATELKLKQLRDKKRDDERKERERNQRAILALLKESALDEVDATKWKSALPEIQKLLALEKSNGRELKTPPPAKPAPGAVDKSAEPLLQP